MYGLYLSENNEDERWTATASFYTTNSASLKRKFWD
jgi:hypothetical protein